MSDKEVLREYRRLSEEEAMLERQLNAEPDPLEDASVRSHRLQALRTIKEEKTQARARLTRRFEQVVCRSPNARQRLVLRQYYGIPMTDQKIAEGFGCTSKAINKLRNDFLRAIDKADAEADGKEG